MLGETPSMSYVHYLGIGDPDTVAAGLGRALDGTTPPEGTEGRTGSGPPSSSTSTPGRVAAVPCSTIEEVPAAPDGSAASGPGYCKTTLPRRNLEVTVDGIGVPAAMGIGSWFAFREVPGGDAAVVTGDTALTAGQVDPAVAALRAEGVDVVALHNHMRFDAPRIHFFHFQARGPADDLARALRSGLDAAGL